MENPEKMSRREMFSWAAGGAAIAGATAFTGWKMLEMHSKVDAIKKKSEAAIEDSRNFIEVKNAIGLSRTLHFTLLDSGLGFGVVEKDGQKGLQISNEQTPILVIEAGKHSISKVSSEEENGVITRLSIGVKDVGSGEEAFYQLK